MSVCPDAEPLVNTTTVTEHEARSTKAVDRAFCFARNSPPTYWEISALQIVSER